MQGHGTAQRGFTLIEISIVLVIIGLIVGGILVGQDLIRAAALRATIAQIEKYNTAVHTFQLKYNNYLPGDIPDPTASSVGLQPRGPSAGQGDGNGVIQGFNTTFGAVNNAVFSGEEAMFWVDLSTAGLIDGTFNTAAPTTVPAGTVQPGNYLPQTKTGRGGYVCVYSGGWSMRWNAISDGLNYFCVTGVLGTLPPGPFTAGSSQTTAALTVSEAYAIDTKIDDGLPQTGTVMAMDENAWAAGGQYISFSDGASYDHGGPVVAGDGIATAPSSTTCYDNGNTAGATEQYSMSTSGGSGVNCALSFKFQ